MALEVKRDGDTITVATVTTAAGAIAAGTTTAVRLPGMVNAFCFELDLTAAATDAGDTLDVTVQTLIDGTNWVDVIHFTQVAGNGGAKRYFAKVSAGLAETMFENGAALAASAVRNLIGDAWRLKYVQVDADANGTFTFSVYAIPM